MIKRIVNFLKGEKTPEIRKYAGVSDFLLHAPVNEKKKVITKAAEKANEDQLKVFEAARLKTKAN